MAQLTVAAAFKLPRALGGLLTSERLFALFKIDESVFDDVIVGSREAPSVPEMIFVAFVVSLVAEGARPLISLALGCMQVGTPLALIAVVNLFDAHDPPVTDPPPPPELLPPPGTNPPPPMGPAHALAANSSGTSAAAMAIQFRRQGE